MREEVVLAETESIAGLTHSLMEYVRRSRNCPRITRSVISEKNNNLLLTSHILTTVTYGTQCRFINFIPLIVLVSEREEQSVLEQQRMV